MAPGHQQQASEPVHQLDDQVGIVGQNGVPDRLARIVLCHPYACRQSIALSGPSSRAPVLAAQIGRYERVYPDLLAGPTHHEPGLTDEPVQRLVGIGSAARRGGRRLACPVSD